MILFFYIIIKIKAEMENFETYIGKVELLQ